MDASLHWSVMIKTVKDSPVHIVHFCVNLLSRNVNQVNRGQVHSRRLDSKIEEAQYVRFRLIKVL